MNNDKKINEWFEISREIVFKKFSRIIEKVTFRLPDNRTDDFYIKKEGPAVGIFALTENQEVILVKQYRPGPKKILHELPGGFLDLNENPEACASRELLEETGYRGDIKFITTCIDDAYSTMIRYYFVATDCKKINEIKRGTEEYIELQLLPIDEFKKILRKGELTDTELGFFALDYLNLL